MSLCKWHTCWNGECSMLWQTQHQPQQSKQKAIQSTITKEEVTSLIWHLCKKSGCARSLASSCYSIQVMFLFLCVQINIFLFGWWGFAMQFSSWVWLATLHDKKRWGTRIRVGL